MSSFPPQASLIIAYLFLPAPSHNAETTNELEYTDDPLTDDKQQAEQNERSRRNREEDLYDQLDKTQPIQVEDGYVTFYHHFKYLGSFISFGLCNDYDIEKRVTAATQSMGALKTVWDSPHLDIWSKYLLFRAIPMNLLLWGCKIWLMRKALSNKLKVFLQSEYPANSLHIYVSSEGRTSTQ